MLSAPKDAPEDTPQVTPEQLRSHFHHIAAATLAHILALFAHPPSSFPQVNTTLIVVDSLSTLIDNAYPRNTDDRLRNKNDQSKWAAGRRYAVINDLIAAFTRFAALHDIALLVTCQTITRIRGASRALLVPAITGVEWENGVSARLLLFRDWVPQQAKTRDKDDADRLQKTRFAGLVKLNGVALADEGGVGNVVPFAIERVSLSMHQCMQTGECHVLLTHISMAFATSTSSLTILPQPWLSLSSRDPLKGPSTTSTRMQLKSQTRTTCTAGLRTTLSPRRGF